MTRRHNQIERCSETDDRAPVAILTESYDEIQKRWHQRKCIEVGAIDQRGEAAVNARNRCSETGQRRWHAETKQEITGKERRDEAESEKMEIPKDWRVGVQELDPVHRTEERNLPV